ncbi:hypothetical protein KBI52_16335 [Microvirga sp. HBU67558]|uniref:hypothetical protein n=1 Tax=Microvirga TaxID=186650 RepID=UPI001B38F5F9|nr:MULTISPECIES: hypothetical protein [unclassified Microvirga]MBQ0821761.1 hypothetical protein [Microvirga sp. HBU67558]
MTKTVTSLFHSEHHATTAVNRLKQAGIPADDLDIWTTPHNLAPLLEDLGVSRADAHAYAEGVVRGGTVVIVRCQAPEVGKVVEILDQEGILDLDEQQAEWRTEGWEAAGPAGDIAPSPDVIPAAAETDRVVEVIHGRIRVQSRRTERPGRE